MLSSPIRSHAFRYTSGALLVLTIVAAGRAVAQGSPPRAAQANNAANNAASGPVDLVARAANAELSAERLALLFSQSRVGASKLTLAATAELWASYQLLAYASAHGDSLFSDNDLVDGVMWNKMIDARVEHGYYDRIRKTFAPPDTVNLDARYARGEWLAAQHILFAFPEGARGKSAKVQDSIRVRAESVRARVTSANFAAMAKQYTDEPEGKERGGSLGVFPRGPADGSMVPMFELALTALRPGQIAPVVVKTEFGYHIIRRPLLAEVRAEFVAQIARVAEPAQRDAYLRRLRAGGGITFPPGAIARIRSGVANNTPAALKRDTSVVALSRIGPFTMRRLAEWLETLPRTSSLPTRLANGPDSTVRRVMTTFIEQELLNTDAIAAGVQPNADAVRKAREEFVVMFNMAAQGLRVDAAALRTAATVAERERLAATRADEMFTKMLSVSEENYVEIPAPLANALARKYPSRVNYDAMEFTAARTVAMRAALDSLRARRAK